MYWPNRNRLPPNGSDGICASAQHTQQNPNSDHETGDAFDITHDPANGCDVDALFALIVERRDPRVKYLIRNARILRSYDKPGIRAWTWAPYTGSNPHKKHGHCSILPGARNDTTPWFANHQQENDMTPEQATQLAETWQRVKNLEAVANRDIDTLAPLIREVLNEVKNDGTGQGPGDVDPDVFVDALRDALVKGTK